jgi:protein N-terminal methyltransferase
MSSTPDWNSQVIFAAWLEEAEGGPDKCVGKDDEGEAQTVKGLWAQLLPEGGNAVAGWYSKGANYWENSTADDEGVLGGLAYISPSDAKESLSFLETLSASYSLPVDRALDCGAGVGRVTEVTLRHKFHRVDLLEQDKALLLEARRRLACPYIPIIGKRSGDNSDREKWQVLVASSSADGPPADSGELCLVESLFCSGLQGFEFPPSRGYSCVWLQWVIGCVTDVDFINFLKKAGSSLLPNGCIVIKDNVLLDHTSDGSDDDDGDGDSKSQRARYFLYDGDDDSICRSEAYLCRVFEAAGMEVILRQPQVDWPSDLLPVVMYALRPRTPT